MSMTGIICEYNPFHRGHAKQIARIKAERPDDTVVCLMSGLFVQRGHPAIFSPVARAEAALRCGADLVLELPVTVSLCSAEGFADGGVEILSRLGVHCLCFGAETGDEEKLTATAGVLLSAEFPEVLRQYLDMGLSFPAARARAAATLGADPEVLTRPNDILAVEYAKAVLKRKTAMTLMPIHRAGDYHDTQPEPDNPSATALRRRILAGEPWAEFVPELAAEVFCAGMPHSLRWGERAMLAKLRSMEDEEFEGLPYGGEGLWRKFMAESRKQNTLEDILTAVKSKRYTRSRLDRMAMCAFLGLRQEDMEETPPCIRILGCNARGRAALRQMNRGDYLINAGKRLDGQWARREEKFLRLYGLFAKETESPSPGLRTVIAD